MNPLTAIRERLESVYEEDRDADTVLLLALVDEYKRALESYAQLPDGKWYGPDDLYEDPGEVARQALERGEALLNGK